MEYLIQIYLLTSQFFQDYPFNKYPELMHKLGRPYACLLIDTHANYYICIPFRSSINHKNAFLFHGTSRSRKSKSGLDYSKIVIITKPEYIDSVNPAIVDQDEYYELMRHLPQVIQEATSYVDTYIHHVNGTATIHPRQFSRQYKYSTLRYFHRELGLNSTMSP